MILLNDIYGLVVRTNKVRYVERACILNEIVNQAPPQLDVQILYMNNVRDTSLKALINIDGDTKE